MSKDFTGIRNNGQLPNPCDICVPDDFIDYLNDYDDSLTSMLQELEKAALSFESGNKSKENVNTIKRVLHKIKGESSMVGIEEVTSLTHETEFAFDELKEDQIPDMLFRYNDWLVKALNTMKQHI